jgi:uncharacterized protein (DUF1697 family)
MTIHVALLRGINVGGNKVVAMADLRDLLAHLGFAGGRSLLQSGNLLFESDGRTGAQLERLLETEAARRFALQTDFFVRTAREWKAIVAHNPFPDEAERDPGHLVAMCLKDAPEASRVKALQAAITGPETLGTRGTGRNWNTVLKLAGLADERP